MNKVHILKVELSLAYGCSESVDHRTMLQYIHYNRHHNSMKINATGTFLSEHCFIEKKTTVDIAK